MCTNTAKTSVHTNRIRPIVWLIIIYGVSQIRLNHKHYQQNLFISIVSTKRISTWSSFKHDSLKKRVQTKALCVCGFGASVPYKWTYCAYYWPGIHCIAYIGPMRDFGSMRRTAVTAANVLDIGSDRLDGSQLCLSHEPASRVTARHVHILPHSAPSKLTRLPSGAYCI